MGELQFGDKMDPKLMGTDKDKVFPRGEVLVRGPNVFQGYFKNEEETKVALDDEGWLHTGDVGMWLQGGQLKIIDRKKNIFKLSQGEYVAPEKIENVYKKSKFVENIFVYGDSLQHQLVAIVVPDVIASVPWLQENLPQHVGAAAEQGAMAAATLSKAAPASSKMDRDAKPESASDAVVEVTPRADVGREKLTALCADPAYRKAILEELRSMGKQAGLHGFENIKHMYLEPVPFTVESGLITATFKSKRPALRDYYRETIDRLYEDLMPT